MALLCCVRLIFFFCKVCYIFLTFDCLSTVPFWFDIFFSNFFCKFLLRYFCGIFFKSFMTHSTDITKIVCYSYHLGLIPILIPRYLHHKLQKWYQDDILSWWYVFFNHDKLRYRRVASSTANPKNKNKKETNPTQMRSCMPWFPGLILSSSCLQTHFVEQTLARTNESNARVN